MAFLFDSGLCALPLLGAAGFAWNAAPPARASVRLNQRFAAMLFAGMGVAALATSLSANLVGLDFAVACLCAALGSTALGLSVFGHLSRPPPAWAATLSLSVGLALGLAASLSGQAAFAVTAILLSAALMLALGFGCLSREPRRATQTILGGLALGCGGMALMQEALASSLLFFAAGLMGLGCASQPRVESQAGDGFVKFVSRARF
jgi:hypothetical protein